MRALIDTCIVIDALQAREPFAEDAQQIFLAVANKRVMGFLTAKSAADIYYITHRHTHNDHETRRVLSTLFTPPKNYKISSAFSYNFKLALTNKRQLWNSRKFSRHPHS